MDESDYSNAADRLLGETQARMDFEEFIRHVRLTTDDEVSLSGRLLDMIGDAFYRPPYENYTNEFLRQIALAVVRANVR
ncbi:hypothetical protein [Rhodobacter viridis]|uniref:hypothetical protein n=1 Tax=Rhodobacter viridis TaxID=1054202 RepID=UPI001C6509D4|nr:hypothetical protein [Rhodobacter viridis]